MFKFLCALLLIPTLSFSAPRNLAERKFPVESEEGGTAGIVKLFNDELAREGSALRKALADVIKEFSDEFGPRIIDAQEHHLMLVDAGSSGGFQSAHYLLPVYVAYKSSTMSVAHLRVRSYVSYHDDGGSSVILEKRVKVTIK